MTEDKKNFKDYISVIDDYLNEVIPPCSSEECRVITEAMRYSVFSGGKRIRPLIVLVVGEILKIEEQRLIPPACGIELIHSFSLVHDDLPAMDDDDYRRGKPTCHKKFGEDVAILAGDALLTLAFGLIAESGNCELIKAAVNAAGANGMAGGQVLDVLNKNKELSPDTRNMINIMKTGRLFELCFYAPIYLAEISQHDKDIIKNIAQNFGLAFQLRDDLQDNEGSRQIIESQLAEIYSELIMSVSTFGTRGTTLKEIIEALYGGFRKI